MELKDIASIVFICVTANHLGLIGAIEGILGKQIPIVNCSKCASFWVTAIYGMGNMGFLWGNIIPLLALSFLASYAAIWLELGMGFIDSIYNNVYENIYPETATHDEDSSVRDESDSDDSMSKL